MSPELKRGLWRRLKREFAETAFDRKRWHALVVKEAVGNITLSEWQELETLQKLRRWKCGCSDCLDL